MAKTIKKTVNRTGKKLVEKALVIKAKKAVKVTDKEAIKKANERVQKSKIKDQNLDQNVKLVEKESKTEEKTKPEEKYNLTIGLKDLLDAGCHLGHKVSKTHPRALENIYTAKDGIQVFDLIKTQAALEKACTFLHNAKKSGKKIVLLGTKRQAREVVKRVAEETGVAYITDRWLGGTITNWNQIYKSVRRLGSLREGLSKGTFKEATKKELLEMNKEMIKLERVLGGLVGLEKIFDVLFVVDVGFEKTAIKEAKLKGIKVVAIVDTDSDPNKADYPIPANDDSVKSVNIIVEEIGRALK